MRKKTHVLVCKCDDTNIYCLEQLKRAALVSMWGAARGENACFHCNVGSHVGARPLYCNMKAPSGASTAEPVIL